MKMLKIVLFLLIILPLSSLGAETKPPASPVLKSMETFDLESLEMLDLKLAQEYAISQNPTIDAALERVKQAQQQIQQARSRYWFRIDSEARATKQRFSKNSREPDISNRLSTNIPADEDFYEVGLTATYTLFDGFDRRFTNLAAKFREKGSREALLDVQRVLLAAVAESYYQAQLQKANVAIAEADKAFNQRQAVEAKARRRVGTGSLSDVLNFEVQVNTAQTALMVAKREYEIALYGLAALMGIPGAQLPSHCKLEKLKDSTEPEMQAPKPTDLIIYAERHRPDVLRTGFLVQEADTQVGRAKSDYYPQIDLFATLDGARDGDAHMARDDFGHSVGVSIKYNIFSGGLRRAQLGEAKSQKKEAQNLYKDILINVRAEVREAISQVQLAQEQLVLQKASTELSQQNRDLVDKEYSAGQASLVRLNEAQRDLINAQGRLVLALVGLRRNWKNLEAATGQILIPFQR